MFFFFLNLEILIICILVKFNQINDVCVCVYVQIFCKQDGHDRYIKSVAARVIQRL
jgi:hypothetical protein